MTERCIECDNIAVKVPLINGDEISHLCSSHLEDIRKSAMLDLGKECFNFVFSSFKHDLWFWGQDIQATLSVVMDDYFTARSRDIYDIGDDKDLGSVIDEHAQNQMIATANNMLEVLFNEALKSSFADEKIEIISADRDLFIAEALKAALKEKAARAKIEKAKAVESAERAKHIAQEATERAKQLTDESDRLKGK